VTIKKEKMSVEFFDASLKRQVSRLIHEVSEALNRHILTFTAD